MVGVVGKVDTGLKEMLAALAAVVAGRKGTALGVVAGIRDVGHMELVVGIQDVGRTELVETSAGCRNQ